jgi:hypothetical protein
MLTSPFIALQGQCTAFAAEIWQSDKLAGEMGHHAVQGFQTGVAG